MYFRQAADTTITSPVVNTTVKRPAPPPAVAPKKPVKPVDNTKQAVNTPERKQQQSYKSPFPSSAAYSKYSCPFMVLYSLYGHIN